MMIDPHTSPDAGAAPIGEMLPLEGADESTQLKEALAMAQKALNQARQREEDLQRVLEAQTMMQPQVFLSQFQENPYGVIQSLVSQAMTERTAVESLENEYRERFPDMVPFRDEILTLAEGLSRHAYQRGEPLDDRGAIELAIQQFKQKLDGYLQQIQQAQRAQDLKQQALSFHVGPADRRPMPSLSAMLAEVGDDDQAFARLKAAYLKQRESQI